MGTLTEVLEDALAGENACVSCNGVVPVTAASVAFVTQLHADGQLDGIESEGVRMLLLLGSVDAGCGVSTEEFGTRPRVSCPSCATAPERALAAAIAGAFGPRADEPVSR
ncbi:MAG TPA: hypothetical protein VHX66_00685 [Solirubrobacteraceae bacterium]|jgi:hypothetical protein|nr:hypothetical protein [Solirubrobacteraceae bacterium]